MGSSGESHAHALRTATIQIPALDAGATRTIPVTWSTPLPGGYTLDVGTHDRVTITPTDLTDAGFTARVVATGITAPTTVTVIAWT